LSPSFFFTGSRTGRNFAERGLNNLICLMHFSGTVNAQYYPGEQYVDIAGPDTYETNQPFSQMYRSAASVIGSTIPIPLHETGTIPDPGAMFNGNAAPWVLFSVWCADFIQVTSINPISAIQRAYGHEKTINRGEMPIF
jgi:hypothetical protein